MDLFEKELAELIHKHGRDSDTPDYILADHLALCLGTFNHMVEKREKWRITELSKIASRK